MRLLSKKSEINKWITEYNLGLSTYKIADKYNVNPEKIRYHLIKRGIKLRSRAITQLGSNNSNWRGDKVGYHQLHRWVEGKLEKPYYCPNCGENRRLDLANISQLYKRDLNDWEWLCRRCHMLKDGRMNNLKKGGSKPRNGPCILCGKPHEARGLCKNHYQNMRRAERLATID